MERKRELTKAEEARLAALAKGDPRLNAMLRLVWNAGLTVAETASLRWEDVDLAVPCVRAGGRTVPLAPEAAAALDRLSRRTEWVFPSRRNAGEPVARMSVNRELRLLLDRAELSRLRPRDLKNLHILRTLEERTLEEAVRITGVEAVTLRDTWREYGRTAPPRPTPAGSAPPDGPALERALEAEGDTLDGRIIRLIWQGGLTLGEIQRLRWEDVPADCARWTVGEGRTERDVPEVLRPYLAEWRTKGGTRPVEGPRSRKPLDVAALSHRTKIFFARHGLEGLSAGGIRGGGQTAERDLERLAELVSCRGHVSRKRARELLGLSENQLRAAAERLRREGRLAPEEGTVLRPPGRRTARERFYAALDGSAGETLSAGELRRRCGVSGGCFYHYVKEALEGGRLKKAGRGLYETPRREE